MASASWDEQLRSLLRASPWLMEALALVRELAPAGACIGAGAIRNLVWDALHGYPCRPLPDSDVDVVYFDAGEPGLARDRPVEAGIEAGLRARLPDLNWEVCNQAGVHFWFESVYGHAVPPLHSLDEAVASWPETATAVAVRLDEAGGLQLIAPFGLADLFGLQVRRNPARVSAATYLQRVAQKRYGERWPRLAVLPP